MVLLMMLMGAGVFLLWLWKRVHKHPVDQLPGPRALPFFGTALTFVCSREEIFRRFNEISQEYQPLYRTWMGSTPVIHLLDPKHIEIVLRSSQHITKSRDYDLLKDWLGTGLLTSGGTKWHSRRKLLTPAFHFNILEQNIPILNEKSSILVMKLRDNINQEEGVDIIPFITRCTLDIICESAMGTELNSQINTDSEYVTALYTINDLFIHRVVRPWLYPDWIYRLTPSGRKNIQALKIVHAFTSQVIKERRSELKMTISKTKAENLTAVEIDLNHHEDQVIGIKKKKSPFLDLLLELSEADPELTDDEIRQEVDTFMFEGHDTTAIAICWTLHYISCYPEIQTQCYAEIRKIFEGSDRAASMSDLNNMKYLERVIKETLRLRPSVYLVSRHLDATLALDEHEFPPGTKVRIQIYNMHRNPEIYPEPEKFDPDRFLPENCIRRHPYAYIPFSAGPRNCIGQKFAMMEMKSTISAILRNFQIEAKTPELSEQVLPDLLLRPKNGIVLGFLPRK